MNRSEQGREGCGDLLKNDLDDTGGYARERLIEKNFGRLMLWPCCSKDFLFCRYHITASANSSTISDKPCLLLHVPKEQRTILIAIFFAYYPPDTRVMLLFNCSMYKLCTLHLSSCAHRFLVVCKDTFQNLQLFHIFSGWDYLLLLLPEKVKILSFKSIQLLFAMCLMVYCTCLLLKRDIL